MKFFSKSLIGHLRASAEILTICLLLLVIPSYAYAYMDPGTGGAIYQLLILAIGFIVGYFAFLKRFIKSLFSRKSKDRTDDKS
jgi:hypothetical protein